MSLPAGWRPAPQDCQSLLQLPQSQLASDAGEIRPVRIPSPPRTIWQDAHWPFPKKNRSPAFTSPGRFKSLAETLRDRTQKEGGTEIFRAKRTAAYPGLPVRIRSWTCFSERLRKDRLSINAGPTLGTGSGFAVTRGAKSRISFRSAGLRSLRSDGKHRTRSYSRDNIKNEISPNSHRTTVYIDPDWTGLEKNLRRQLGLARTVARGADHAKGRRRRTGSPGSQT